MIASDPGVPWEQLNSVLCYSCISSLYIMFCVKCSRISNLPPKRGAVSDMFCVGKNPIGRFVKFTKLLPCEKAKCINETETSKLPVTLLAGKFWVTHHTAQTLRWVTFIFFCYLKHHLGSNHYNHNELAKTTVTFWLLGTGSKLRWRRYSKFSCKVFMRV